MNLTTQSPLAPLTEIKGLGPKLAAQFAERGFSSILDICYLLPTGYQDRTRITPIAEAAEGNSCLLVGKITGYRIGFGQKRSALLTLRDTSGSLTIRLFHFSQKQLHTLEAAQRVAVFGEVKINFQGQKELVHPEIDLLSNASTSPVKDCLTPIYPSMTGVASHRLKRLIEQALDIALPYLAEHPPLTERYLPQEIGSISLANALKALHFPSTDMDLMDLVEGRHPAVKRLAFEEFIAHNLSMLTLRANIQQQTATAFFASNANEKMFLASLPFSPTKGQTDAIEDIYRDLAQPYPMMRLLQGDVGTGKTLVAALAALRAIGQGAQVAIMVPTEILAGQHFENFVEWFSPLGLNVGVLTSRHKGKKREALLHALASGTLNLIVGTHALLQSDVNFDRLGLVIIDEQHRFGVHQRLLLSQSDDVSCPHQLIMTATPIPRTLAMTSYANLDCSVIREYPADRKPIITRLINKAREQELISRLASLCEKGDQIYWVCTLVEESEHLDAQAAFDRLESLQRLLPKFSIGLVHGKMKPAEKQAAMSAFESGETNILVATTVIEVGINVPNASAIVIENPERLGLAQLHQLRGRVGRGHKQSHCLLLYEQPLSANAKRRLECMKRTNDGFEIAETDLEIRGPGEVLGHRQTGELSFRVANLMRDADLLDQVKISAEKILASHPTEVEALIAPWVGEGLSLAQA